MGWKPRIDRINIGKRSKIKLLVNNEVDSKLQKMLHTQNISTKLHVVCTYGASRVVLQEVSSRGSILGNNFRQGTVHDSLL